VPWQKRNEKAHPDRHIPIFVGVYVPILLSGRRLTKLSVGIVCISILIASKSKTKDLFFFGQLQDFAKRRLGDLSAKYFSEADCGIPREKRILSFSTYPQPMPQGDPSATSDITRPWVYPQPGSAMERDLNQVCALAEKK
jgi:hypothetical protein